MAEELPKRQSETLRGRIHGSVLGKPVDVKGFEAHPHGVRRISEAAMRERIGHERVAEFVVDAGNGDGEKRNAKNKKEPPGATGRSAFVLKSAATGRQFDQTARNPRSTKPQFVR